MTPARALAEQVTAILARDTGRTDADLAAVLGVTTQRLSPVIGMLYRRGLADRCGPYIVAPPGPARTEPAPPPMRRVLVTGSRTWADETVIAAALRPCLAPGTVLVSGACPHGADAIAERLWQSWGGKAERHPADWDTGRQAGFARNAAMVALGADICLAFIRDDSPGATHAARLAEQAGIPVRRFTHPAACAGGSRDSRDSRDIAGQGRHGFFGVTAEAVTLISERAFGAQTPLAAALAYAALGWPVFWLGKSKRPVVNCKACPKGGHDPADCGHLTCHGFHAATTSPERIAAMRRAVPGGLLAIRTGQASGLAVIDIDPRNGGQIDHELMTPTAAVATGGGGWHLYYRHPGGPLLPDLPGHPGVDVKADGGYTVAPPSVHPGTGKPYQWAARRAMSEMPPALRAALTRPEPPPVPAVPAAARTTPQRAAGAGGISDPAALLASHLRAIQNAPEGTRRRTLYGAARGVARMVTAGAITETEAVAALTAAGRAASQTDRDIHSAITAAFQAEGAAA